ncbi:serine/threonine-protein kinase ZRK1-like [Carya illinoinensis]|uniref:Protein kinase domain-containing protein n=1 Tax=Carya illinoinensis TaxID=32201 RepID=A0A8T1PVE1_CARIL|nr:serine/threonine-protein kinase ZRK1-like [Carya illinoinensis]KAG6645804.1 hypothetical protein CIPAW_08G148500 [Carya illinoinensis]
MLGKVEREKLFVENGSILLEKLIACGSSRSIPIRSFSIKELLKATNNFDPHLLFHKDGFFQWYNGSFEDRFISVKKYYTKREFKEAHREFSKGIPDLPFTDMAICAKMCAHKNVLKLIGCCLETPSPVLVYESDENRTLSDRILASNPQDRPMPWTSRLKVAREIAHAIAYLHTAFSRPIVHGNIKPGNIFFDQRDIPKLSDFSMCIEIPEGEIEVIDLVGSRCITCPYYIGAGIVTEKTDVHSFGYLLLEIVAGKSLRDLCRGTGYFTNWQDYTRTNIVKNVESAIQAGEVEAGLKQQLQASMELSRICRDENPESRPTMVDVTKELRRIERSIP